jgi:hypothetical protein
MKKLILVILVLLVGVNENFAFQNFTQRDSVEVYLLDSYIAPEKPTVFNLSFISSVPVKSGILLDNKYRIVISDSLTDSHQAKIDLAGKEFPGKVVPFYITVEDSAGNITRTDSYNLDFPKEIKIEKESNFLLLGLFFGTQFLLPSPEYVRTNNTDFFALTKEIPLISFRSQNINFPFGYFSIEYTHIFNADASNFFRLGYKQIIELPIFKYISPGISGFTNFDGFSGIGLETSLGLADILNTFTLYVRYRFNTQPGKSERNFHEISLGIYSNFFSFHF